MVRFRSIVLAGLAVMALAFAYVLPTSADYRDPGLHGIGFAEGAYLMSPVYDIAPSPATIEPADPVATRPDRPRAAAVMGPIYALSLETHGQSLLAERWRS